MRVQKLKSINTIRENFRCDTKTLVGNSVGKMIQSFILSFFKNKYL